MKNQCSDSSCDNQCGLFDFMANTIGVKVLHPGGYEATNKIFTTLNIDENAYVLDLACGTGTTSFYLSKKCGCKISGIDMSESLIYDAITNLKKFNNKDSINFEVGNALKLPYKDDTFDFVIVQAFLILIDEKEGALDEIYRVLKPGGCVGSLELSWFKKPSKEAYDELVEKTCHDFIPRVVPFEEWEELFKSKKFNHIKTIKTQMSSGMLQMMKTEGIINFIKIMFKMISNSKNRKRMMDVQKTFSKYQDYLGYGIFCYKK